MENRETSGGSGTFVAYAVIAVVVLGATAGLIYQMGPDAVGMGQSRTSSVAPVAPPMDLDLSGLMNRAGGAAPARPTLITPDSEVTVLEPKSKGGAWKALFDSTKGMGADPAPAKAVPAAAKREVSKPGSAKASKPPASNKRPGSSSHASAGH